MTIKRRVLDTTRQYGFDPVKFFYGVASTPRFIKLFFFGYRRFKGNKVIAPILSDHRAQSGDADGHYFWQDLIVARWIYEANPRLHFDVGSRIDGFVAHLLSFREATQLDIRETSNRIPGLHKVLGDAQLALTNYKKKYDSVSTLHSIEHFGLGRYGDSIDVLGHVKGLINIADCVEIGGLFYVSFPIGKFEVQFNAQRILDPSWIIDKLPNFELLEFVLIPWKGQPVYGISPSDVDTSIEGQAGIYRLKRIS